MLTNFAEVKAAHARFISAHERMVERTLAKAAPEAQRDAQGTSSGKRNRSGKLARSTKVVVIRGRVMRLKATAPYASYVEHGTRPHVIMARRRRFLRFVKSGRVIYARRVMHPGTRAYKFLSGARDRAFDRLGFQLRNGMERLARLF